MSVFYAQPLAGTQPADAPLAAPALLTNIIASILDADKVTLQVMDENTRLASLFALAKETPPGTAQDKANIALFRLLYHRPYPKEMQEEDVKAAKGFFNKWHRRLGPLPFSSTSPQKIFQVDCYTALRALGLDDTEVGLRFEQNSFAAKKEPPFLNSDFTGAACVSTERDGLAYSALLETNSDLNFWKEAVKRGDRQTRITIAGMSFHEICHVDQKIDIFADPLEDGDTVTDTIPRIMGFEQNALADRIHLHKIYRCTLMERQAYFRQALFTDLAHGSMPRTAERFHLDAGVNIEMLQAASETLIAKASSLKPTARPA